MRRSTKRRPQAVPRVQAFTGRDIDAADARDELLDGLRSGALAIPIWLAVGLALTFGAPTLLAAIGLL